MDGSKRALYPFLQPHLHAAATIRADPVLACTIRSFVNEGYRYMSPANALRWDPDPDDRLPTVDSIHEALGEDGLFAVIYNPQDQGVPIACAATKRWTNDLEGYASHGEEGWEIKTVTTRSEWMRRGLAVRCVESLVQELLEQARKDEQLERGRKVQVWVQAFECLNGEFWKKQGWVEVRSHEMPKGHRGSKMGCRLLVLLQEFSI